MTLDEVITHIRENAPEVEGTFRAICENRYCHPARYWAIYDIAQERKISIESAERRHYGQEGGQFLHAPTTFGSFSRLAAMSASEGTESVIFPSLNAW